MIDFHPYPQVQPQLSLIVALADDYAIGRDNDLIWHISDDLKRFKSLTSGHTVIMGRNTWNSLPKKPLPKRRNIVVTHDPTFAPDGAEVAHSIQEAIRMSQSDDEVFVMGGATLYQQFLPYVQRLFVTHVYASFPDADVRFPVIDMSLFRQVAQTDKVVDSESQLTYNYIDYERIPQPYKGNF